jgi:peptidoglycan/LPS O-acetylase OafA/YrhL
MTKIDFVDNIFEKVRISPGITSPKEQLLSVATSGWKLGHRPELDGLRGISILVVYFHHLYRPLMPAGYLGVDIFFVLSGFLITSLLVDEWNRKGSIRLKDFYIRRALRLMPAVFLLILIVGALSVFVDRWTATEIHRGIWLTLVYISNWFYALGYYTRDNPLSITWSLAIEEQFYLTWPLLLALALRLKLQRWIMYVLALIIVIIPIYRGILVEQGAEALRLYYGSDTHADGLLIGCLVGLLVSWNLLPQNKKFEICMKFLSVMGIFFFGYLLINYSPLGGRFLFQYGGYTLVLFSIALCLTTVVLYSPKFALLVLGFKPLVWIGRISYGLYLWHWTVYWFIYAKRALSNPLGQLAAMVILSLLLPTLSYYFVEKPFLRWKKRFGSHGE